MLPGFPRTFLGGAEFLSISMCFCKTGKPEKNKKKNRGVPRLGQTSVVILDPLREAMVPARDVEPPLNRTATKTPAGCTANHLPSPKMTSKPMHLEEKNCTVRETRA